MKRAVALLVSVVALALGAVTATPAEAVVLVSAPPRTAFCLDRIKLGVWYQAYSGGSRRYRVAVFNPAGRRVFLRTGIAPSSRWRIFRFRPIDYPGVRFGWSRYRVVYRNPTWGRAVFRIRVLCGE